MSSAVALLSNIGRPSDASLGAPVVARPVADPAASTKPGAVQPVRTPLTTDQASSIAQQLVAGPQKSGGAQQTGHVDRDNDGD